MVFCMYHFNFVYDLCRGCKCIYVWAGAVSERISRGFSTSKGPLHNLTQIVIGGIETGNLIADF